MAKKLHEVLKISEDQLKQYGAYNFVVGLDSLFHIDPYLLNDTTVPELKNSHQTVEDYFTNVLKLIEASEYQKNRFWREAQNKLRFKEVSLINLGYSKSSNKGSAIGPKLAATLCETASELIKAGIKDPVIFELVGLFEEGIGADRISDMIARIILTDLFNYTDRILKQLKIKNTKKITYKNKEYNLPFYSEPILFLPIEILSPLPVAYGWDDIDIVCAYNDSLREKVNKIIGNNWRRATNQKYVSKRTLKSILLHEPDVMRDLISLYREKPIDRYDFESDPLGETKWLDISKEYTNKFFFSLTQFTPLSHKNILDLVIEICNKFGELIEDNGLFKVIYDDQFNLRHERFPQLLFYGIADSYCAANNLDISREPNAGRGSVDFKFSSGYHSRVNVEVKYSTNNQLVSGYQRQLPIYDKAEKTFHSIYLVLQVSNSTRSIDKLFKIKNEAANKGLRTPDIIVIDSRYKKSASKAE